MTSYALKTPIVTTFKVAGQADREETTNEVTIRTPVARDLRVSDTVQGEVARSIALISQLTGMPTIQVEKLSVPDFQAIMSIINGFFQDGQATGESSSET